MFGASVFGAFAFGVSAISGPGAVNGSINVTLSQVTANFSATSEPATPPAPSNSGSVFGVTSYGSSSFGGSVLSVAPPVYSIDTYPTDIAFNGTNYNYSTSGLGTITSLTLDDGGGNGPIALTTFTDTTFDGPSLADAIRPLVGTVTLEASDGTNSASQSINLNPAATHTLVTIQAGFSTGPLSWLYQWGGTPAVGMQAQFISADFNSIDGLGNFEKVGAGSSTAYLSDPADNQMQSFAIVTGPAVDGAINVTLDEIQASFNGTVTGVTPTVSGLIDVSLDEMQVSFTGTVSGPVANVSGAINVSLDEVQANFAGQSLPQASTVTGTFNINLAEVTATWSATFEFQDLEIAGCVDFSEGMNS